MSKNFNFQVNTSFNSNFGNKKKRKSQKMTAQQEYWLNRILRDHSKQIFIVLVLFLLMNIVAVGAMMYFGYTGENAKTEKNVGVFNIQLSN